MEDFKGQIAAVIDEVLAAGVQPVFLVVDLEGIQEIKARGSQESLERMQQSAIDSIVWTAQAAGAMLYDERCVVAVMPGVDRLKTFSRIEKLRRGLPLLAQSYDCALQPSFDVVEYDESQGVAGLVKHLVGRGNAERRAA